MLAAGGEDVPAKSVELVQEQRLEMLAVESISPRFHFKRNWIPLVLFRRKLEIHRCLLWALLVLTQFAGVGEAGMSAS